MVAPPDAGDRVARPQSGSGLVYWLGEAPARLLSLIACVMLFFMMVLTFVDVAGRYLFASPLPAAYEIVAFTMPAIIFCALPLTNLREGHVTVDIFDSLVPNWWRRTQAILVNLVVAGATGFIAWRLAARSYDHFRFREVTDELWLPMWPFSTAMAVLCAIAAVVALAAMWGHVVKSPYGVRR
ncbi:MAG: TRAP transporter small permease [Pseudomonadota bacterium]